MACYLAAPSHYLKQCWNSVNWTPGNKLQWDFNRNLYIFIQENALENVVYENGGRFVWALMWYATKHQNWTAICLISLASAWFRHSSCTLRHIICSWCMSIWCFLYVVNKISSRFHLMILSKTRRIAQLHDKCMNMIHIRNKSHYHIMTTTPCLWATVSSVTFCG